MATDSSEFTKLANQILFKGLVLSVDTAPEGFEYRSKKTADDLRKAIHRGVKNGRGKTEFEISFVALALKTVLKIKRVSKPEHALADAVEGTGGLFEDP